jgi:preprotein translocase subunit SecA
MSQEEWQKAHERVVSLGGLAVVGTEHHEARRIDNQLRGRSGRQGDPGSTRFYASLEDDLMRRFGGDRIKAVMNWAGIDEDTPIENRMVTRAIASAQVRTEAYHFDIRKTLLDYDDVLNRQREVIYAERKKVLSGADLRANILEMLEKEVRQALSSHLPGRDSEHWDLEKLVEELNRFIPLPGELKDPEELEKLARDEIEERFLKCVHDLYEQREQEMGLENARLLERLAMLRAVDYHWVHHLTNMENLRQGIGMYAVGQRDPLVEYKTEGHRRFSELLQSIQRDIASTIFHMRIAPGPGGQRNAPKPSPMAAVAKQGSEAVLAGKHKVGRNDPCPCGSGKKYKKCHGANA